MPLPGDRATAAVSSLGQASGLESAVWIAQLARQAMLAELEADPKPGLVCPSHNGAHRDMDYAAFRASAAALFPFFTECARIGQATAATPPEAAMPLLRQAGRDGEAAMYAATGGVNTHKGQVFSLGLLAAALGRLLRRQESGRAPAGQEAAPGLPFSPRDLAAAAASFVPGLVNRELEPLRASLPRRQLSAGERIWLQYGVSGIRGEAEAGFPSALRAASLIAEFSRRESMDRVLPHVLLHCLTFVEDSNLLARGGRKGLDYARNAAFQALAAGGMFSEQGRRLMYAMREDFPRRRLSPGGCADILALAVFFHSLAIPGRDEQGLWPQGRPCPPEDAEPWS